MAVDNGSTDESYKYLKSLRDEVIPFTIVRSKLNLGPGGAKNVGARKANTDILAFLDDACIPSEDWVENIRQSFLDKSTKVVFGQVTSAIPHLAPFIFARNTQGESFDTGNAAFRREVFKTLGGFDLNVNVKDEGIDIHGRIKKMGISALYNDELIVDCPAKLVPFKFREHILRVKELEKNDYLTNKLGYAHLGDDYLSKRVKKAAVKFVPLLIIAVAPIPYWPFVNIFCLLLFYSLLVSIGFRNLIQLNALLGDYSEDKISFFNQVYYCLTAWALDGAHSWVIFKYRWAKRKKISP